MSLEAVSGLAARADDELDRMARDFAAERRAAGRPVPTDLDRLTPARSDVAHPRPHIHMTSRTTDDYEAMYAAGVRALVEPAFWLGQPRTSVGSFTDYFDSLLGWERFRAAQFGIRHHATIALNPKEANDPRCARCSPRSPATCSRTAWSPSARSATTR